MASSAQGTRQFPAVLLRIAIAGAIGLLPASFRFAIRAASQEAADRCEEREAHECDKAPGAARSRASTSILLAHAPSPSSDSLCELAGEPTNAGMGCHSMDPALLCAGLCV